MRVLSDRVAQTIVVMLAWCICSWPTGADLPEERRGIAARYPGDAGIEQDPDVLFVERFDGASVDEMRGVGIQPTALRSCRFRPTPHQEFLVSLLPILRGIRLGLAGYADRFTYLPAIGLTVALVWAVGEAMERCRGVRPAAAPDRLAASLCRSVLPVALAIGLIAGMALAVAPADADMARQRDAVSPCAGGDGQQHGGPRQLGHVPAGRGSAGRSSGPS